MRPHCFPRLRWVALAALAIYVPAYSIAYGFANFLFLCNLAVILAAIGIWTCSRLLISSQAVGILPVSAAWTLDVIARLVRGRHLIGATEYMWDPQLPLFTRLVSGYHVVLPIVLVLALRRIGYDRRGYLLQSAIAIVGVVLSRLFGPVANINYAFVDPILKRTWGGPVTHIAVVSAALIFVGYPLSHLVLVTLCPARAAKPPERADP